jgi:DNA-binding transcriptional regulator LsrR (DeoR family)
MSKTKEQLLSILEDYYQLGLSEKQLARKYGMSVEQIIKIIESYPYH